MAHCDLIKALTTFQSSKTKGFDNDLQDLDTDDLEGFEFSTKFRAKTTGDMEKLMACVGQSNYPPNYSKIQLKLN